MEKNEQDVAHLEQAREENESEKVDDYAPEEIQNEARNLDDPAWVLAQRRYLWKLDCIILPAISILYFFEYLDRGNVAVGFLSITAVLQKLYLIYCRMRSCTD
jgi:hypothetical protein